MHHSAQNSRRRAGRAARFGAAFRSVKHSLVRIRNGIRAGIAPVVVHTLIRGCIRRIIFIGTIIAIVAIRHWFRILPVFSAADPRRARVCIRDQPTTGAAAAVPTRVPPTTAATAATTAATHTNTAASVAAQRHGGTLRSLFIE